MKTVSFSIGFLLMALLHELFKCVRLIMHGKPVDHRGAGFIEADNLDIGTLAAEFDHHHVQRFNAGYVPDMGAGNVDHHLFHGFMEIECGVEILNGRKEKLTFDVIGARRTIV